MREIMTDDESRPGPAYFQEMPEYVPMDAAPEGEEKPKTQEGLEFFCPACGKKIPLGADICPECGASLTDLWAEKDDNLREGSEDFRGLGKEGSDAAGSELGDDTGSGGSVNL